MGKRKNIPSRAVSAPPVRKHPALSKRVLDGDDALQCHPLWSFKAVDPNSGADFGWDLVTPEEKAVIVDFLCDIGSCTWSEIRAQQYGGRNRHRKNHEHAIEQLPAEAQARLATIQKDDRETLFRFRLNGKQRLWGIVEEEVFYALWWDPNHRVYPVGAH